MKHYYLSFFIATLMSMAYTMASAHDIAVANSDGKTIYYNYNSDGTSVSVTYQGTYSSNYSNEYSGEIVIPETVTYSGKTYSVTSIGYSAFDGCSGLTSVTIPNSVTSIGSSAFRGCSGLTKVIVPNFDIKKWCSIEFGNSSNPLYYSHHLYSDENTEITKLVIPDGVTSIPNYVFFGCSGLTSVTIPNSVTTIGEWAFSGCSGLTKVIVPNFDVKNWCSIKFSSSTNNPLYYAHHLYSDENTEITKLVIPDGVTSIPNYVFFGCSGLTSVIIPNSVTSIGERAFCDCSGLTSVTIPNSVTSIGSYAFYGTAWYNNQPDGLVYAGNVAYKYKGTMPANTSITLKEGTVGIASGAFFYCSGMTSVTIPNSVTSIGAIAFYGCSRLTSVTIPNSVTSIGKEAFYGCSGLTSVTIPNSVTSIGYDTFSGCSGLTSMIIPNSVTSIGAMAFYGCSGLTLVIIGNSVTSIGYDAFRGCSGLISVTIPSSVTCIDENAFQGCSNLTSINSEIKNPFILGANAFSDISNQCVLTVPVGKRDAYIAKGWTTDVFQGGIVEGTNLYCGYCGDGVIYTYDETTKTLTIEGNNAMADYSDPSLCPWYSYRSDIQTLVIKDGVTSIGAGAFCGCSGLTSVTIPNSVTSIGSQAFYGCSGLTKVIVPNFDIKNWCSIGFGDYYSNPLQYAHHLYSDENTEITKLVIPDGVTSIDSYAFSGCSGLSSVTIPNSVTSIGEDAFYGCSGLTSVTIPNSVTSIGEDAFSGCSGLTSVTIPNSVTSIGSGAFSDCSGLTEIKVADGNNVYDSRNNCNAIINTSSNTLIAGCKNTIIPNSVTSIGSSAFSYCRGLTSLTIPNSVTSISKFAFYGCRGLTSVTIPESVTSIGSSAFFGCSGLTSVRFENSKDNTPVTLGNNYVFSACPLDEVYIGRKLSYTKTKRAGYSPFYKKTTLRSVKFTDKETEISDYEFYGCTNLTDVSMGDGVKSIGAYAFSGCSSLEQFTCGRQLESIGKKAFSDCTSMTKFRTRAAVPPTCGAQALDDINKWECTLYVPTESIDDYQAADQWKNFFIEKFRVEGDSNGDDTVTMADANAIVNYFLAKSTYGFMEGDFDEETADVNSDGEVTMADANQIVNMFLSEE